MNQLELLKILSESNRFKDIKVVRYLNKLKKDIEEQFIGMTFILNDEELFVSFGGTSDDLVAWKEDFNLSFLDVIPSQKEAVNYLNDILTHTTKKVYVGGHSKGGNLAIYSLVFSDRKYNSQIVKAFNNDGPGFKNDFFKLEEYQNVKDKIITFIPKSSIVGNLFVNNTKTYLVDSYQLGILEHDLFSWRISGNHFKYQKEITANTKKLCEKLNSILESIPLTQKKRIINIIYDILNDSSITSLEDVLKQPKFLTKFKLSNDDINIILKLIPLIINLLK
jgi:hypothetical protein